MKKDIKEVTNHGLGHHTRIFKVVCFITPNFCNLLTILVSVIYVCLSKSNKQKKISAHSSPEFPTLEYRSPPFVRVEDIVSLTYSLIKTKSRVSLAMFKHYQETDAMAEDALMFEPMWHATDLDQMNKQPG